MGVAPLADWIWTRDDPFFVRAAVGDRLDYHADWHSDYGMGAHKKDRQQIDFPLFFPWDFMGDDCDHL